MTRRGTCCQMVHPGLQESFFLAARRDSLTAGMLQSIGRFGDKQRAFGVRPVDQRTQPPSKVFDIFCRRRFWRKVQTSRRSNAIVGMTALGTSLNSIFGSVSTTLNNAT